jgi:hypothetical protein
MKALKSRVAIGLVAALVGALTAGYASYALAAENGGAASLNTGAGSVRARVVRVSNGASTHLEVPNLVDLAVRCYDENHGGNVSTTLTLTNKRAQVVFAWIADEGSNPLFFTIPPNGVQTYPLTDQGLQVHVVFGPDISASGPVHIKNRGTNCLVGIELASNT